MAQNKKNIVTPILFVALVGVAFISVPLLKSTDPVDQVAVKTTRLNIADVSPGSSRLFRFTRSMKIEKKDGSNVWHHGNALFLVKDKNAEVYLYYLPMWQSKVMMPHKHWWQHEGYCADLVAEFAEGENPVIHCRNPEGTALQTRQWKWSIDGKNLGTELPDMISVGYRQQGDIIEAFYR